MLRLSTNWILCGALALPIGFGIGYALDVKIPANATSYQTPTQDPLAVAKKPQAPVVPDRVATKEPERTPPPPAAVPTPPPAKTATPAPQPTPPPVTTKVDPPAKVDAPTTPTARLKGPRLEFDKGSISVEGDEIKVRSPYGNFSFNF